MPVSINRGAQKKSPLSDLADVISIAQGGLNLYKGLSGEVRDYNQRAEQDREKLATSPESEMARADYGKALGSPIADTVSLYQLKQKYGPLSEFALSGFKTGEQSKRDIEKLKQEHMNKMAEIAATGEQSRQTAFAKGERNPNEFAFKQLPMENQEQIKKLADRMANQTAIRQSLDSALEILKSPNVSEDQKVVVGKSLLKTINSEQGQDAIGAEEAKRLGSFLEYKIANFTEPGSVWGRDLDKFTDQTALASSKIKLAREKNQGEIDRLYGRSASNPAQLQLPELSRDGTGKKRELTKKSAQSGLAPDANAAVGTETIFRGIKIRRVPGGWEY